MMHDELGMDDGRDSGGCDHWKSGAICFVSFLVNGLVPLLGYVAFMPAGFEKETLFYISCSLTATMLFVLGAVKSRFTTRTWYWSGLEILGMGAATAGCAYLIGWAVEHAVSSSR